MPPVKTLPLHLLTQRLRLRITLSDRISDIEIDVWRRRMTAYVSALGLSARASPDGLTVVAGRRAAWARDRGVVLDWLIEQPEVAQVLVEPAGKGIRTEVKCQGVRGWHEGLRLGEASLRRYRLGQQQWTGCSERHVLGR